MRKLILITGTALTIACSAAYAEPTPSNFSNTFNEWTSGGGTGVDLTSVTDVTAFEQAVVATLGNHKTALEGIKNIIDQQQQLIDDLTNRLATAESNIQDLIDAQP